MILHPIDSAIILVYLVLAVALGIIISKKASQNMNNYFLGGNKLPWYVLGVSNASGMFDITGTMWLVYISFVYGLKAIWLPFIWPVFNQIFFMVYLSGWLRKSNAITGAEWMTKRFGTDRGSELSRISVVIFALMSGIGFLAYAFKGIGKFAAVFLPWDLSPDMYSVLFMGVTAIYVIIGGMYSVTLTDLMQFFILTIASIIIGVIAFNHVSPEALAAVVPDGWLSIWPEKSLSINWSGFIDAVNDKISSDGYSLFSFMLFMMLFKGLFVSLAGPVPRYDMQRILSTKDAREASLMSSMVTMAITFPRFLMVIGITVLGLVFFSPQLQAMGADIDFETILPFVINNYIPVGLTGLLLAGLFAAFMSTFDSTVNAAAAYIVNDIYKRYINPNAADKTYVRASYVASILLVLIGISFGFVVDTINSITQWIFVALLGGYAAPNVLKWYWWRFNGYGYFWGMISGMVAAVIMPNAFPALDALLAFPFILGASFIGCFVGTLLTKPTDSNTLQNFYKNVRPWGFWKPIFTKINSHDPTIKPNTNMKRDMTNVLVGMVWQLSLIALPYFIIVKMPLYCIIDIILIAVTSIFLKFNWYDKLRESL